MIANEKDLNMFAENAYQPPEILEKCEDGVYRNRYTPGRAIYSADKLMYDYDQSVFVPVA